MNRLTVEDLHGLLRCDPEAGRLFWRERETRRIECEFKGMRRVVFANAHFNAAFANKETALCLNSRGYRFLGINGWSYTAHRVVWAMSTGDWPAMQVDHVNGDRTDNRIENLRLASARENSVNKKKKQSATSNYFGVYFRHDTNVFSAQIKDHGKRLHLGCFKSEEDAARAFDRAAMRIHGEFAKLNFRVQ